jgi:ferredoxin-NADP reductase
VVSASAGNIHHGRDRDYRLSQHAALSAPIFYFAGPPKMVAGVSNAVEAGVDPTRVQSEEFDGY